MDRSSTDSSQDDFETNPPRQRHRPSRSARHPIPTIQKYREHRSQLETQQHEKEQSEKQPGDEKQTKPKRALESVKAILKGEDEEPTDSAYLAENQHSMKATEADIQNNSQLEQLHDGTDQNARSAASANDLSKSRRPLKSGHDNPNHGQSQGKSATEVAASHTNIREKRRAMKHNQRDDGGREVTDPVTHLPLVIHDSTEKDLKTLPRNDPKPGSEARTSTGLSGASKEEDQLKSEQDEGQLGLNALKTLFPPPTFNETRHEVLALFRLALGIAVAFIIVVILVLAFILGRFSHTSNENTHFLARWTESKERSNLTWFIWLLLPLVGVCLIYCFVQGVQGWLRAKLAGIWEDEIWEAARTEEHLLNKDGTQMPESVAWLNSLMGSVWPLINPDLFASLADMLEDVMQASLSKLIRMVSIDDLGQGSESIRILGVRWLPTGAASQSVDANGKLKKPSNKDGSDRMTPGDGALTATDTEDEHESQGAYTSDTNDRDRQQEQQSIKEGMEAEQGDFVNIELAFAYRARPSGRTIREKSKNAHLYLKFYLTDGVYVPVWVELKGFVGIMRARLQLTPDPPFFSLCTLTFLGQPKADISCVPLSKRLPNLMDVPFISSFVQTSIDAAISQYVAPKSLTLDLKDMLVGDDFKKNTLARGVVVIFIKEAKGFKQGDVSMILKKGSSDAYVTCSWAKFGKTLAATRVIAEESNPQWHEWAYLLVTPEEIDAQEHLKLQLWDSDKHTADDDLGSVEIDLKELMHDSKTKNCMRDREDGLRGESHDEELPGTLSWSVGYFEKCRITDEQVASHSRFKDINSRHDLKEFVSDEAEHKLREANARDFADAEIHQQKIQDYHEREDFLISSSPPRASHRSGILSVQIHNITNLSTALLNRRKDDDISEDAADQSEELPSSTCTVVLNHEMVYRTRTKPKTANPFFNAGTERFICDWRVAEVMIAVHDSREGESDALMGIVYLPLAKIFDSRSQIIDTYPLAGGVGYGRIRISLVFRSVELQLPRELSGWRYGTLEITCPVRARGHLEDGLSNHRLKLRSDLSKVKLASKNGQWEDKHGKESRFLACKNRYTVPLILEWRASVIGPDSTPAFAVFWLQDLPDEEEQTIPLKIWRAGKERMKRATSCYGYEGLDPNEQPLGMIELKMKFWTGLSGYHKAYAKSEKSRRMKKVMEILDTANDEAKESDDDSEGEHDVTRGPNSEDGRASAPDRTATAEDKAKKESLQTHANQDYSSPSSSDSNSDGEESSPTRNPLKKIKSKLTPDTLKDQATDTGERNLVSKAKEYKQNHRQLHRKHRGVMQWKGVRSLEWMGGTVKRGAQGIVGQEGLLRGSLMEHGEKGDREVETEV